MNVANYEQRVVLSAHRQKVRVTHSPLVKVVDSVKNAPAHYKAAAMILAYFVVFAFLFQASQVEFNNKGLAYLSPANRSGNGAISVTAQSTNRPTQSSKTITPTPTPSQAPNTNPSQAGLPPYNTENESAPSRAIQYTATGYAYGQCTWYVSHRRPIPQNWGNARDWLTRAKAAGFVTGVHARVGAIAQTRAGYYGHVAYVERIEEGGRVYVSEMNYVGWNRISYRWANESEFSYIY